MPLLKEQLALFQSKRVEDAGLPGGVFKADKFSVCLKQDDCLSFLSSLPTNSVDLIVTDPAYSGMNAMLQLGHGRIVGHYQEKGTENGKWFAEFADSLENYDRFLAQCRRVLRKDRGHIYIMFDSYSLLTLGSLVRDYFDVKNIITWDKINLGMGHYFRRRHEYILFATNGNNRKIRNRSIPDVWRFKRIYKAEYATQKPVELFQAMIFASAEEDYVVCDPFVGSGSAAIAAIKNGCNFLGCDLSPAAMSLSCERVQQFMATGVDPLQKKSASISGEKVFWQ